MIAAFLLLFALAPMDSQPKTLPLPSALPIEQIVAVLKHKDMAIKWLNEVEQYAESRMSEGHNIPGFKLVLSRGGNRYWSDEKKAAELLTKTTVTRQ